MSVTRLLSKPAARSLQRAAGVAAAVVLACGALAGLVVSCANESTPPPATSVPSPSVAASPSPATTPTQTATASPTTTPSPAPAARASVSPTPTVAEPAAEGGDAESGQGPGLADSINQLSWVRDGLEGDERYAAFLLDGIGDASPPVLEALLSVEREFLPPRSAQDVGILEHLLPLTTANADLALRAMDAVLPRRQGADAIAWFSLARYLEGRAPYLVIGDIEQLRYAVDQGTADPGLAENYLLYFQVTNEGAFRTTAALPWVAEAGSLVRTRPGFTLLQVGLTAPALFDAISERTWLDDGLSKSEISVIEDPMSMFNDPEKSLGDDVLRLARGSFLDDVTETDALALRSMVYAKGKGAAYINRIFDRLLSSGDVGDEEAYCLAVLDVASYPTLETVDAILDEEFLSNSRRELELPSGKVMTLVGISTAVDVESGLDTLEYAVVQVERLMGVELPLETLYLMTSDQYILRAGFQGGIVRGRLSLGNNLYTMAHEVAHVYWGMPPFWLNEGAAELLASLVFYKDHTFGSDAPSPFDRGKCEAFENLEQVEIAGGAHGCAYVLGLGLFGSLYEALGEEQFWGGFRTLHELVEADADRNIHLAGQRPRNPGLCFGEQQGLCYVRAAFVESAEPEVAAVAEEVITRWYFGTPQEGYGQ